MYISYAEVFNDTVVDLLLDLVNHPKYPKEKQDEGSDQNVKKFTEIEVNSVGDALLVIKWALENRSPELPLSHKVLTVKLAHKHYSYSRKNKEKSSYFMYSELTIVDLAYQNKNFNYSLKEAEAIKSSLMALRNCIEALKEKNRVYFNFNPILLFKFYKTLQFKTIPYKESKLTLLLNKYFQENSRVKMILCLNPSISEFDQTCVSC